MKIERPGVKGSAETYRSNATQSKNSAPVSGVPVPSKTDQVSLSPQAQQVNALQAKLRQEPAVRMELVERIKAQIAAGTYQIEARQVADKMLKARVIE